MSQTDLDSYLADFTLSTDTAKGVLALQKLAEEHHCGANLTVEPYEGLRKVRLLLASLYGLRWQQDIIVYTIWYLVFKYQVVFFKSTCTLCI